MIMKSRVGLLLAGVLAAVVPSASRAAVSLSVGDISGMPGQQVTFTVSLNVDGGDAVKSYGIEFLDAQKPQVEVPLKGTSMSNADCALADGVEATLNQYKYCTEQMVGGKAVCQTGICTGLACPSIKVAILGPEEFYTTSGPSFTCKLNIAADAAAGDYTILLKQGCIVKSDNTSSCADVMGKVTVSGGDTPIPTSTNTEAPAATSTPTVAVDTPTVPPANTPTRTATAGVATSTPVRTSTSVSVATATKTAVGPTKTATVLAGANDGCQANPNSNSSASLILLLPIAVASLVRRRIRR